MSFNFWKIFWKTYGWFKNYFRHTLTPHLLHLLLRQTGWRIWSHQLASSSLPLPSPLTRVSDMVTICLARGKTLCQYVFTFQGICVLLLDKRLEAYLPLYESPNISNDICFYCVSSALTYLVCFHKIVNQDFKHFSCNNMLKIFLY